MDEEQNKTALFMGSFRDLIYELGILHKGGKNGYHKYTYLSHEDLMASIMPVLVKHGFYISHTEFSGLDVSGTRTRIRYEVMIVHAESGIGKSAVAFGEGDDKGDKGIAKAQTQAEKIAWKTAFGLASSDDPEADYKTDKRVEEAEVAEVEPRPISAAPTPTPDANSWGDVVTQITGAKSLSELEAITMPKNIAPSSEHRAAMVDATNRVAEVFGVSYDEAKAAVIK